MGNLVNGEWMLGLMWRRNLFAWEVGLLNDLPGALKFLSNLYRSRYPGWKYDLTEIF
jgi:hypothetical protein